MPRGRRPLRLSLPDRPPDPRVLRGGRPVRSPARGGPRLPEPASRARRVRAAAPGALLRHRDEPRRARPLLHRHLRTRRRAGLAGQAGRRRTARGSPGWLDRRAGPDRARVSRGVPGPRPLGGPRRADRLEHRRLRRHGPPAGGAAGGTHARAGAHGRGGAGAPRPRVHPRSPRDSVRPASARRPGPPAERVREARRLPARDGGPGHPRYRQDLRGRAPRPGDRGGVARRPRAARRVQPARRPAGRRHPRADGARRAGRAPELAHRDAGRPGRRSDRRGGLAVPGGAPGSRARGPLGPRGGRRGHGHRGRPRPRLRPGPLPEHPGVRLQEPLPEPHPDLQHRSPDARRARPRGAGDPRRPHAERRALPGRRARHPPGPGRAPLGRARPGPEGRRPRRRPGDEDPHELPLRRPGRRGVAPLLAAGRQRDHDRRPARDPAGGGGRRGGRPPRDLRRHGLPVRRRGHADPRPGRGVRRGAPGGHRRPRGRAPPSRVRRRELARARVREGVRALLDARGPRRDGGQQEALRGADRRSSGGQTRAGRSGGGPAGLERGGTAVPAGAPPAGLPRPAGRRLHPGLRGRPPGRSPRRRAGLPKGDPQAARGVHEDDAAARQGRTQASRRAGPHRGLRRHHGRAGSVGETTAPPDYDHYVTQQLRPIADALLRFVGAADFDTIADIRRPEGRQLGLFPEGDLS